jgi:hypothetical protein
VVVLELMVGHDNEDEVNAEDEEEEKEDAENDEYDDEKASLFLDSMPARERGGERERGSVSACVCFVSECMCVGG